MSVPVVDLVAAERGEGLEALDAACRDHGFFLLSNHGMTAAIEEMWRTSAAFFSLPAEAKRSVLRSEEVPLGYYDRELTKRRRDLKEVFDYMKPREDRSDMNQWPAEPPGFRESVLAFFDAATVVADRTLAVVYRALVNDVDTSALPFGSDRTSTVRLNYYPVDDPLSPEEQGTVAELGDMALHHHTDPGVITLLLQDMVGGLQTLSKAHGWIDVPPAEDTIVVNLGDAMQVWTNDAYVAAVHRVLPRPAGQARYSTPYFMNPAANATLEPLSALLEGAAPRYRAFTWREYIQGRVDDNYADLGEDDIQIERFRVA